MHRHFAGFILLAAWLGAGLVACGDDDGGGAGDTTAYFALPREGETREFFELPWPCDVRRDADGTVSLAGYPADTALVMDYVATFDASVTGFSTSGGAFFRFSGPLDPATLPGTATASLSAAATAYLVNLEAGSPEYGTRVPVYVTFKAAENLYIGPNHLVVMPVPGFVLREGTRYGAVLTRGIRDADGRPVNPAAEFTAMLADAASADPVVEAARARFAPLRAYLAAEGIAPASVLNATVFTTQSFVAEMTRLREAVYEDMPEPPAAPADLAYAGKPAGYAIFTGTFEGPIYQQGEPPYATQGGNIVFDGTGRPVLVRTEPIRFALSVPSAEPPAAGWPIVLYAHGTGGDYMSHVDEGVAFDLATIQADGDVIARAAVVGIDQVLHGTRCSGSACNPELNFFNFQNPLAGRDNVRQGALDHVQLLRLVLGMDVPSAPTTGQAIRFDPDQVYFMGHSQGGLTGPPFIAVEPALKAVVLSGSGGNIIQSLLLKTEPVDIPGAVQLILGEEEPLDAFHPFLSLLQMFIDPADPANYARYFWREPLADAPKHVYVSQGWTDHYTPPPLTEALAVAASLDLVSPTVEPQPVHALTGQVEPLARPVSGNRADGAITAVYLQYRADGYDGHFVVFDNPDAKADYRRFIGTCIRDGLPSILD